MSKAGIDHLVRNAAGELAKFGIRVNSIQVGSTGRRRVLMKTRMDLCGINAVLIASFSSLVLSEPSSRTGWSKIPRRSPIIWTTHL